MKTNTAGSGKLDPPCYNNNNNNNNDDDEDDEEGAETHTFVELPPQSSNKEFSTGVMPTSTGEAVIGRVTDAAFLLSRFWVKDDGLWTIFSPTGQQQGVVRTPEKRRDP